MRKKNSLFGYLVMLLGFFILLEILIESIDISDFFGPALFFIIGLHFYRRGRKLLGGSLLAISVVILFNVFSVDISGLVFAFALIVAGYYLLSTKHKRPKKVREDEEESPTFTTDWDKEFDKEFEEAMGHQMHSQGGTSSHSSSHKKHAHSFDDHVAVNFSRSSLIGDFKMVDQRFELKHSKISNGIGDMTIDLSKAIILQEETTLQLSGMIGDITIYVPYDLDVFVEASVTVGDLEVLGYKQGGLNRKVKVKSNRYDHSIKKVKLDISLQVGDVSVRYI
ncbi:cell wall-active antibiotics response protein LiaF [Aureibacillus halotolerans]|uniref:Lia operon protein LiaF n=1 Tax=Aureibacillus halotolerans TaxID=1508390 RepID=A0A4R6U6Y3_9BACI|nr:cell wall-active antibiotics response protein LiaF [Aureibacillus halotolerans]TDQ40479.1 lia operon protein LiaF [Aureibacillus halotolerans]